MVKLAQGREKDPQAVASLPTVKEKQSQAMATPALAKAKQPQAMGKHPQGDALDFQVVAKPAKVKECVKSNRV